MAMWIYVARNSIGGKRFILWIRAVRVDGHHFRYDRMAQLMVSFDEGSGVG